MLHGAIEFNKKKLLYTARCKIPIKFPCFKKSMLLIQMEVFALVFRNWNVRKLNKLYKRLCMIVYYYLLGYLARDYENFISNFHNAKHFILSDTYGNV